MASGKNVPPRNRAAEVSKPTKGTDSGEPDARAPRYSSADLSDLVKGIGPELLTEFLKEDKRLASKLLRGFRVTPRTVKMPVVHQRILQEAEAKPELQEMLEILWVDSNKDLWAKIELALVKEIKEGLDDIVREHGLEATRVALMLDERRTVNRLVGQLDRYAVAPEPEEAIHQEKPATQAAPRDDGMRDENRKLKQKVRELEEHRRKLEHTLEQRSHEVKHEQAEARTAFQQKAEAERHLAKLEKTVDRLRRGSEQAEGARLELERKLKAARKEIKALKEQLAAPKRTPDTGARAHSPDWVPVITTMLRNRSYQAAKVFCETLKELEPESLYVHLSLEHVYAKTGVIEKQTEECLCIAERLCERGQPTRACAFAFRALEVDPTNTLVRARLKDALGRVNLSDDSALSAIRGLFARLRAESPNAHRAASTIAKQLGRDHARLLDSQPKVLHVDKMIDLSDGTRSMQTSIRRIMEAVDSNDVELVEFLRIALANLKRTNPVSYRTLMEGLGSQDRSCVAAIMNGGEPVVVDGSNVAWHEIRTKPRLQNILELRSELRSEGFFPVLIYVDAALPYQVDQQSALRQLIDSGAVQVVASHTDADEEITRQARELCCPVVTNDRMHDWDPEGEIPKLRFAIDRLGVTIYDG